MSGKGRGGNCRAAVYAGTFDPITLGHLDVIKRGLKMFDSLTVAVTTKTSKRPLFTLEERVALVKGAVKGMRGVQVKSFSGLLVDFVRGENTNTILRGLRELSDFEREFQQAIMNRKLNNAIDTVFIMTSAEYFYLSSSAVREIAAVGGNTKCFVPENVSMALGKKLGK
ncbi:pantetheine-phosphate adenylyltransferase [Candidatus Micrarchaeota archaeon]|nr:pantetheine-phosphate adenylyltransferase [Candidatus Micrarchaeota archaeon]MBU1939674.1 pantetheine-phosphate adenylyltransferase [Candidatus Micrarchaeota archaeon]